MHRVLAPRIVLDTARQFGQIRWIFTHTSSTMAAYSVIASLAPVGVWRRPGVSMSKVSRRAITVWNSPRASGASTVSTVRCEVRR